MDPKQLHELLERMRGMDSARTNDPASEHRGPDGKPLQDPATALSAADRRLWMDSMAARYDDLHAGYTTSSGRSGRELAGTPLEKLADATSAASLATGTWGGKASTPALRGFFGMAAHTEGLTPGERLQTWGLDSDHQFARARRGAGKTHRGHPRSLRRARHRRPAIP